MKNLKIRFQGEEYILPGSLEDGGGIVKAEDYANFNCGFAHLMEDGRVMRYGKQIGKREDIEVIGEDDTSPTTLAGLLTDPNWKLL